MNVTKGSTRNFGHCLETTAAPQAIWSLWTTPSTWQMWDLGLKSAKLEMPFVAGAIGSILPKSGPSSKFSVTRVEDGRRCTFVTALPLASLVVDRSLTTLANGKTRITHEVSFSGPFAALWAMVFGPSFMRDLPPTMERLAALACERATL
jgi:hypothetical protein